MTELLNELDYANLPELEQHRWLALERIAKARLSEELESNEGELPPNELKAHYMEIVESLAQVYSVHDVKRESGLAINVAYDRFLLAVTSAKSKIWATLGSTDSVGSTELDRPTKKRLLELADEMESEIERESLSKSQRKSLNKILEDFRREVKQPRTRISNALTLVGQLSTVALISTAVTAQASNTYLNAIQILAAEQSKITSPELVLIEVQQERLLLAPPPKQIEGPENGKKP